jgi:hypothetical protein
MGLARMRARVFFAKRYLEGMCLMFFPWAESVSAKCGRENNEEKIRIYDLENNGGGLNTLEPIHPVISTILYGHGEFIFPDTLSSH